MRGSNRHGSRVLIPGHSASHISAGAQPVARILPDPRAFGFPHSVLRYDATNRRWYQSREFGAGNLPIRDVDLTNPTYPTGIVRPHHPGPPHQHRWIPNDPNDPRAGVRRGVPEQWP